MEKSDFVVSAPSYYAVAIAVAVSRAQSVTIGAIRRRFTTDNANEVYQEYLKNDELLKRGIEVAKNFGLIVVVHDQFGPDIIKRADEYWNAWREVIANQDTPFSKYALAGDDGEEWLRRALSSINGEFDRLGIQEDDFDKIDQ